MAKKMTKKQSAEMYRLMKRIHRLKATRKQQSRYMVLARQHRQETFDGVDVTVRETEAAKA
jgi:hypothetical protein